MTPKMRHGRPVEEEIQLRLLSRILIGGGPGYGGDTCWTWTGGLTQSGYGQVHYQNRNRPAHRLSYELFRGPIPENHDLDHLCQNPACIYPGHLEPVTPRVNQVRSPSTIAGSNTRKTHCTYGHEFTDENTRLDSRGSRRCKTCEAARIYAQRNGLDFASVARSRPTGVDLRRRPS